MTLGTERADVDLREELRAIRQRLFEMERAVKDYSATDRALPDADFDVLACRVETDRVALALGEVREVLPVAEMLPIPESPPWMCGMLDVGGKTVPVLDVAARFRRAPRTFDLTELIVVCRTEARDVGLVVQEVFELQRVDRSRVSPPVDELPHASYVRGTIRDNDGQMLLLSLARLIETSDVPDTAEGVTR